MKKIIVGIVGAAVVLSSCGSATATGAYMGGEFGHVIGSAIGGINGGWRGHHMGSLIGTVGGVVAGAAVGAAVDAAQQRRYERAMEQRGYDGYDPTMQGDDRITFDPGTPSYPDESAAQGSIHIGSHPSAPVTTQSVRAADLGKRPPIEIRNAHVIDATHDGVLTRGEECTVTFEIMNNTSSPVFDIYPLVSDVTGNKHVCVSPNLRVESISPYQGVRYTATILADKRLKDGEIVIRVSVAQRDTEITSQMQEFTLPTRKKVAQ